MLFYICINCVFYSLLILHDFLHKHFWFVFWVITLSYNSMIFCFVNSLHSLLYQIFLFKSKLSFFLLVLFYLLLENLCYCLVCTWEEVVGKKYFFAVGEVVVVVYCWVQIKQQRQIQTLIRIKQLVFKAKTLYFIEIQGAFFRKDLIDGYACDWTICSVINFVECKGSLSCIYNHIWRTWFKLPWNLILSVAQKAYSELSKYAYIFFFMLVFLSMLLHSKSESLAYYIVEWNSQEITS